MRVRRLHETLELSRPFTHPGKPGITRVIGSIMQTLYPDRYKGGEFNPVRGRMGYLWEDALALTLADYDKRIVRPTRPFELDGIVGYPDGIHVRRPVAIVECKLTYASSRREIDDPFFAYYHMQGQALCHMSGIDTIIYYVLFICGNYKRPYEPVIKQAAITWTEEEMDDNWCAIVREAQEKEWI